MEQSLASLVEDILRIIDKAVKQHNDNKDIIEVQLNVLTFYMKLN